MSYQNLLLHTDAATGVATLTLNRPAARNSFSAELLREIRAALAEVAGQRAARALLLTGNGASFCAGADLSGQTGGTREQIASAGADSQRDWINPIVTDLQSLPFPTVAAVNGSAAGAGASLALACDVVIAARSAFFLFPFMPRLGIVPDMGATWFLPRLLGSARAMALSLIGDRLPAPQAAEWGLIWRCVEDAALMDEAQALAQRVAKAPAHAALELRRAFAASAARDLPGQLDYEVERQRQLLARAEFEEGVRSFLEKREPTFPPRA
ncbi:MAG: enoyl-CoA hydratase [Panacagrimonas sp.]|nr:enoyl-CoA hydratase-related protein [Panacagrimonas sp.]MCC2655725.1 enoyl-CoA hydratase [Panacagrimonas sp.]